MTGLVTRAKLAASAMVARGARRLRPLAWRAQALFYRGSRFHCSACGEDARAFLTLTGHCRIRGELIDLSTPNAICPRCRSNLRQRLLAQVIRTRTDLLAGEKRVLHIAPEACIHDLVQPRTDYLGLDINPDRFRDAVAGDVTDLGYRERFDAIICSHVLEHIPDDAVAMAELFKALKPDGVALIQVPTYGDVTYQLAGLDEKGRLREYGCADHHRLNGRDFAARLKAVGFNVEILAVADVPGNYVDRSVSTPHTRSDDLLFVARRPR